MPSYNLLVQKRSSYGFWACLHPYYPYLALCGELGFSYSFSIAGSVYPLKRHNSVQSGV